jgi:hypothetical protein
MRDTAPIKIWIYRCGYFVFAPNTSKSCFPGYYANESPHVRPLGKPSEVFFKLQALHENGTRTMLMPGWWNLFNGPCGGLALIKACSRKQMKDGQFCPRLDSAPRLGC